VSPAAVVPVCDRLEKEGYIQRIADTADRRITWVQLTAAGASFFDEMAFVHRSRLEPALATLSVADRNTLSRLLDRLAAGLGSSTVSATHTHRRPTPVPRERRPRG
jgi:DNA-binding MarR family transcriptional regulator